MSHYRRTLVPAHLPLSNPQGHAEQIRVSESVRASTGGLSGGDSRADLDTPRTESPPLPLRLTPHARGLLVRPSLEIPAASELSELRGSGIQQLELLGIRPCLQRSETLALSISSFISARNHLSGQKNATRYAG